MAIEQCGNCRYWQMDGFDHGLGDCHRHPPLKIETRPRFDHPSGDWKIVFEHNWPPMRKHDWCGEFQPLKEK